VADNLKAIETEYRGCTFRSRLEARWAVFFDEMGWTWQYEHQGYECGWRLYNWHSEYDSSEKFYYLPDFFLPDLNTFVEVKAQMNDQQLDRFLNAAAHLSNYGENNPQVLVLCDLRSTPHPDWTFIPKVLRFHKGDLGMKEHSAFMAPKRSTPDWWFGEWIASDWAGPGIQAPYMFYSRTLDGIRFDLLEKLHSSSDASPEYLRAIKAAKSARFEHGWSGPTLGRVTRG
jgi:hypothetical protein